MALTHHYLVQLAALRKDRNGLTGLTTQSGKRELFTKYRLLGDDIVICDQRVAESYLSIINSLGMTISEPKTHISIHTYEFAKRWFMDGVEITGFGIGGLLSVRKSYALIHNFLQTQRQHGWAMTLDQALSVFRHVNRADYTVGTKPDGKKFKSHRVHNPWFRRQAYLFSIF